MASTDHIAKLHATLRRRETPETVAKLVRDALPAITLIKLYPLLAEIIGRSVKGYFGWSSMATTFRQPVGAERQIAKARELALLFMGDRLPQGDDPEALDSIIDELDRLIGKTRGRSSFKEDRLGRSSRKAMGLSRRRYAKLFRLAGRLENKATVIRNEQAKFELVLVSKAALAPRLTVEDFGGDILTTAFVAYYSARMKLRSEFTIGGQQRPFDGLSAALLALCEKNRKTRWWAIAHVFPRADVLARLSDQERGQLLGIWFNILQLLADRLDDLRARSDINMETMIVKRGDDSSTWNILAGAWNRARDHWIALVEAMGIDALFDTLMPGKVMRLMAGDVAAWHRLSGGGLHPDTLVWLDLPQPWQVLRGEVACTRADVEAVCALHNVDPVKNGWSQPRDRKSVAEFRPTPELVHGVTVSNPYLADYLRRRGVFSGKSLKTNTSLD
jgi:hypothetical protein